MSRWGFFDRVLVECVLTLMVAVLAFRAAGTFSTAWLRLPAYLVATAFAGWHLYGFALGLTRGIRWRREQRARGPSTAGIEPVSCATCSMPAIYTDWRESAPAEAVAVASPMCPDCRAPIAEQAKFQDADGNEIGPVYEHEDGSPVCGERP